MAHWLIKLVIRISVTNLAESAREKEKESEVGRREDVKLTEGARLCREDEENWFWGIDRAVVKMVTREEPPLFSTNNPRYLIGLVISKVFRLF